MARGVHVTAAPAKSGALITAELALGYNRDVFVGKTADNRFFGEGCEKLAAEGATVAQKTADVLADWGIELPHERERAGQEGNDLSLAEKMARELGLG
jgi:DNA processing protein